MPRIDPDKVKLLHGPYQTPRLRRGDRAQCLYRDKDVSVTGMSSGRIPWPLCKPIGPGHPGLLVEEELARAVRCESVLAVRYWWGASPPAVWRWRKALGVPRQDPAKRQTGRGRTRQVRPLPDSVKQTLASVTPSG